MRFQFPRYESGIERIVAFATWYSSSSNKGASPAGGLSPVSSS